MKSIVINTPLGFPIRLCADGNFYSATSLDEPFPSNWDTLAICNWLLAEDWPAVFASNYKPMEVEL